MRTVRTSLALLWAFCLLGCDKGGPPIASEKAGSDGPLRKGGWERLSWGMSAKEVLAATGGAFRVTAGSDGMKRSVWTVGNVGPYQVTNFTFEAVSYYGRDGLTAVALTRTAGENCNRLRDDLRAKYGNDVDSTDTDLSRWGSDWFMPKSNLKVHYSGDIEDPMSCEVLYEPIYGREQRGL